jgi:hypothetical protein
VSTSDRIGSVVRARIVRPESSLITLKRKRRGTITRSLVPGASTERNGRVWRIGRTVLEDDFLYGLLGVERREAAEFWNQTAKDFENAGKLVNIVSPFVIRLTDLELAFQLRHPDIQLTSFTDAIEKILREETGENWRIEATEGAEIPFGQWRRSVDAVHQIRFHIVRPNPNYEGRPDLERLIEGARLTAANIDLQSDTGITTDSDIVRQLLDHADAGNGSYVASAERPAVDGHRVETLFSSELHGETEVTVLPADPDTGEVSREALLLMLT